MTKKPINPVEYAAALECAIAYVGAQADKYALPYNGSDGLQILLLSPAEMLSMINHPRKVAAGVFGLIDHRFDVTRLSYGAYSAAGLFRGAADTKRAIALAPDDHSKFIRFEDIRAAHREEGHAWREWEQIVRRALLIEYPGSVIQDMSKIQNFDLLITYSDGYRERIEVKGLDGGLMKNKKVR